MYRAGDGSTPWRTEFNGSNLTMSPATLISGLCLHLPLGLRTLELIPHPFQCFQLLRRKQFLRQRAEIYHNELFSGQRCLLTCLPEGWTNSLGRNRKQATSSSLEIGQRPLFEQLH